MKEIGSRCFVCNLLLPERIVSERERAGAAAEEQDQPTEILNFFPDKFWTD